MKISQLRFTGLFLAAMGALCASNSIRPVWAQGTPGEGQGEGDKAADGQTPGEGDQPEEKKDPTDIRNAIGNLNMIRGFQKLATPPKAGAWSKIVNQPYYPPPVKAQKLLFHGQYEDAEAKYNALLKEQPENQQYLEGDLEAVLRQGHTADIKRFVAKYNELTDAQRATPKMARLRAEAFVLSGQADEGLALLKAFVAAHPKLDPNDGQTLHAYNEYAGLLELRADYAAAAGIYDQIAACIEGKFPSDPEAATQLAIAIYRGGILAGDVRDKNRSVIYQLAQARTEDQTYWPAMLAEAEIMVATHNDQDAGTAVAQVLDLNPNETEARFLSIDHAISQYSFDAAQDQLNELQQRTDSAEVAAYEGRMWLKERQPEKAISPLQRAIRQDPTLPEARGWLAGAYYLLNDASKMSEQLRAIRTEAGGGAGNADAGGIAGSTEYAGAHPVALFQAAEILKDARQFTTAEKLYLQAQQSAQWWSEPPAALAELYLEMGLETKAKAAYEKAYQLDPYNLRAVNQLKLLDILQKFASKESSTRLPGTDLPVFIVKYDPRDEIVATLALQWMEKVRPELWSYFHVTSMPAPTVIEFFPNHQEFGVRTTGLPWIGTVGASTGNVIAMDVPRTGGKNMMGTFDWARVLRHEYTHTITLAMTNNRIPHWLTEAAAVNQEEAPRDWENCQLLASNDRAGQLFKIADLNWGFIKPKRTIDRQLAYMESQWIYEYLVTTYGLPKMLDFLQCFHDGLTEPQAWKKTYGKTTEQMDTEFLAWAAKQIESWGLSSEPLPKRADLDAVLKDKPNDPDALYKISLLMASSGDNAHARENLEKLIALNPSKKIEIEAKELLGAVLNSLKQNDKAREILTAVVKEDPRRPLALRTLGYMALADSKLDDAEKWFTQLQAARPLEESSYSSLAGIYLVKKENDKAMAQLLELERHNQRDERIPRKLADLFMEAGNLPEAEHAAYRAIRINPFNAINHQLLGQILMAQGHADQAVLYWTSATALQPKVPEFWEGLADAQGALAHKDQAAAAAKKAVELQPSSKASKWLQQ